VFINQAEKMNGATQNPIPLGKFPAEDLIAVIEQHVKWLRGEAHGERAILVNADLACADLACVNLEKADLTRATLYLTNFHNVDLRGANLEGAFFAKCILSNANFEDVNIKGSNFKRSDLAVTRDLAKDRASR